MFSLFSCLFGIFTDSSIQDWLYDEGEDATKAIYIAKIEEIRMAAGPIIQRYLDKQQEEAEAAAKKVAEEQERKRAEKEAAAKAEADKMFPDDAEMKDAPVPAEEKKEDNVEEMD